MLVLRRKAGEAIVLNGVITIHVLAVEGERVKLGISAPPEVVIVRSELLEGQGQMGNPGSSYGSTPSPMSREMPRPYRDPEREPRPYRDPEPRPYREPERDDEGYDDDGTPRPRGIGTHHGPSRYGPRRTYGENGPSLGSGPLRYR